RSTTCRSSATCAPRSAWSSSGNSATLPIKEEPMRFRRRGFVCALAAIVAACGLMSASAPASAGTPLGQPAPKPAARLRAAQSIPTGFLLKTIQQGDTEYRYVLYVPPDYDASKAWPTILFLHGSGECGRDGLKPVAVGIGPALMLDS